jgi:hypothetical protein
MKSSFLLIINIKALIKLFNITGIILFTLVTCFSCQEKYASSDSSDKEDEMEIQKDHSAEKLTVGEFVAWCGDENNKLTKIKTISDIRFNLTYLPAETMAYLELRTEDYDLAKFQRATKNYSEMTYFNFKMEVINGTGELLKYKLQSPSQYDGRVKYTAFEMQNDFCLIQGKDTLLPGLYQFERIFEVGPYANMMLAFDNKKFNKNDEFTIVYNDRLFEKGFVKFNYKNKQLINLPNISEL